MELDACLGYVAADGAAGYAGIVEPAEAVVNRVPLVAGGNEASFIHIGDGYPVCGHDEEPTGFGAHADGATQVQCEAVVWLGLVVCWLWWWHGVTL